MKEAVKQVAQAAEALRQALKALNPEGSLPSYFNPYPAGWSGTALPWSDTLVSNALHYASALTLDEEDEE